MIQVIDTTEPAEASLTKRIEELTRKQQRLEAEMLKTEGALDELRRWKQEIWGDKQGEIDAGK